MLKINKAFTLVSGRLLPAAVFLALAAFPPLPADAQGLLDRIESRVRSRIEAYRAAQPNGEQATTEQQPRDGRDVNPRENRGAESRRAPASRRAPTLGIEARASTELVAGVQVLRFFSHSQAQEAGLRPGDLVAAVNGSPTPSIADIGQELSRHQIGDSVLLAVVRAGRLIQMEVPLVENLVSPQEQRRYAPGDDARPRGWIPPIAPTPPVRQLPPGPFADPRPDDQLPRETAEPGSDAVPRGEVQRPDNTDPPPRPEPERLPRGTPKAQTDQPERDRETGTTESPRVNPVLGVEVTDGTNSRGATVRKVDPDSPAAIAGIRTDDRIVAVEGRVVRGSADLQREIDRLEPGRTVTLQAVRGGAFVEVDATLTKPSRTAAQNPSATPDDQPSPDTADSNEPSDSKEPSSSKNWAQSLGSAVGGLFGGTATKPSETSSSQDSEEQPTKGDKTPKESPASDSADDRKPAAEELPAPSASDS